MKQQRDIRRCTVCVLDNSSFDLEFDGNGQCFACKRAIARMPAEWIRGAAGAEHLRQMTETLKAKGRGKPYDAMVGLSGGIDSAYLAHVAVRDLGLRVLAVHVDGGWNSSPAVQNIERIVRSLDLDLFTHVVEWSEMADLQSAFLRSGVYNQDIPQDHAFFSTLFRKANELRIDHFLSGVNFSSEGVSPKVNAVTYHDGAHIKGIHQRFGQRKLRRYKTMSLVEYAYLTKVMKRPQILTPLNFMDYDKEAAKEVLRRDYGWVDYGEKHCESRFTKFYQEIYLPRKFDQDKRQLYLSSLIVSKQITREAALQELNTPNTDAESTRRDICFVAKKLGMTPRDLEVLIEAPPVNHLDYPNGKWVYDLFFKIRSLLTGRLAPK